MVNAAGEQPVVLIVDDLHWADRDSLEVFRYVARFTGRCPLLLIGIYRDPDAAGDRRESLNETLVALARRWQRPTAVLRALDVAARDLIFRHGDIIEAQERSTELLRAGEQYGSIPAQAEALVQLSLCHARLGNPAAARETQQQAGELVSRLGAGHRLHALANMSSGALPILSSLPGFEAPSIVRSDDDTLAAISIFADRAAAEWVRNLQRVRQESGGPVQVGTTFRAQAGPPPVALRQKVPMMVHFLTGVITGAKTFSRAEITGLEPNRRIAWKAGVPKGDGYFSLAHWEFSLEAQGQATCLTQRFVYQPPNSVFQRMIDAAGAWGLEQACAASLDQLKQRLQRRSV